MKLVALKDAFKAEALDVDGVNKFIFDDTSAINTPSIAMRVFLFKPPNSTRLAAPDKDYLIYSIGYFLFDLMGDKVGEAEAPVWESLNDDVVTINKAIVDNNTDIVEIIGDTTFTISHHDHNPDLIGVWCQYQLRVFDCLNP